LVKDSNCNIRHARNIGNGDDMDLQIRRLAYHIGAEIVGVDLGRSLDDATFGRIRSAFHDHCVLVFRAQDLTQQQHIDFSRRFGQLDDNESTPRDRDSERHEILLNTNKPQADGNAHYGGTRWHADRAYSCVGALASLLRAVEIPDVGGDTMFCNMYLAYETLSERMRRLLDGLHGVHEGGRRIVDRSTPEREAATQHLSRAVAHPVVRVHPETGRKALFVTEKMKQFVGLTEDESRPWAEFLCKHATQPQFIYRHRWQKHDLVMWDNSCTLHIALNDYDKRQYRHMERTTVKGALTGYVYKAPAH
jgi:taurine dioxygenase